MTANHTHRCGCGTELHCAQEPDKCAVIEPWACPTCLDRQQEIEVMALAINRHLDMLTRTHTHKETH